MAIIKNEIPILEFDTEQTAVLNPTHENLGLNVPVIPTETFTSLLA